MILLITDRTESGLIVYQLRYTSNVLKIKEAGLREARVRTVPLSRDS